MSRLTVFPDVLLYEDLAGVIRQIDFTIGIVISTAIAGIGF